MKPSYTFQQRRDVIRLYKTYTIYETAAMTGLPEYTVRNIVYYSRTDEDYKITRWTDEEIQYIRDHYRQQTDTSIAQHLHRSRQSVSSKLHALGLRRAGKRMIQAIEEAMKIYPHHTNDELMLRFGLSRRSILNAAYVRGLVKDPSLRSTRGRKKKNNLNTNTI